MAILVKAYNFWRIGISYSKQPLSFAKSSTKNHIFCGISQFTEIQRWSSHWYISPRIKHQHKRPTKKRCSSEDPTQRVNNIWVTNKSNLFPTTSVIYTGWEVSLSERCVAKQYFSQVENSSAHHCWQLWRYRSALCLRVHWKKKKLKTLVSKKMLLLKRNTPLPMKTNDLIGDFSYLNGLLIAPSFLMSNEPGQLLTAFFNWSNVSKNPKQH